MKTKHTPGPWHVAPCFMIEAENGDYVCKLGASEGREHHYNGPLIAAAPSLLEALTALLTYCEAQNYQIELDKGWGESVMNRTRSAIARATGGDK